MAQRPASNSPQSEHVFVSPRVVDETAFDGFAERLRQLIDGAGAQLSELGEALAEADDVRESIQQFSTRERERIERAAELAEAIDARASHIEELLERASEIAQINERFEFESTRVLGPKVSDLEKRMAQSLSAFTLQLEQRADAQTKSIKQSLAKMSEGRESVQRQVEHLVLKSLNALQEQCDRAEHLIGRKFGAPDAEGNPRPTSGSLGDLIDRAGDLAERVADAQAELASCDERLDEVRKRADEEIARARDEAISHTAAIKDRLDGAAEAAATFVDNAHEQADDLERRLEEAATRAAGAAECLERLTSDASASAERLDARIDAARSLESAAKSARENCAQLEHASDRAERAASTIASVLDRLEPWREVLLEPGERATLPEPIVGLIRDIRRELSADLRELAGAMTRVADRAESNRAEVVVRPASVGQPSEPDARAPGSSPSSSSESAPSTTSSSSQPSASRSSSVRVTNTSPPSPA